ncbi:pentatricopeptide repeat-containing protein At1g07740, mitochondrial-like [Phoenix dactylifera]|uniref:Pentatricopeptide repeat-containing protein At1g07740, mitochondrial-like n=1 Tax=Phoenix dactylifera TaxID=42345 RepID=A0A8B8ZT38_PHODC|nr:pentatricopeptide repeat-containing protein At1g07740, mitochondrial-like [Phoenix dactylifera]
MLARAKKALRAKHRGSSSSRRPRTPERRRPRKAAIPFLAELKSISDPAAALRHLLSASPRFHDYPACAALVYRLARARLFSHLDSLLHFLRSQQIPCKEPLFNSLIHHFGRARLPDRALRLFLDLPSFNCPSAPSLQTFNFLLNSLVDNDRLEDARGLLDRCSHFYVCPNTVSYNIILKGSCCEKDGLQEARRVFDEMVKRGVRPSVVTYNILIGFLTRYGDVNMGLRLKEEMSEKGMHANAVTYALLMEGLCLEGKYDAAKKMMLDMEYQGCKTKVVNYGVLMSDRTRRGDFQGVEELLAEMKRRKIKPDVAIYNISIGYLCVEGRVDEAYKVLVDMQMKGCEPGAATYRMMLDGFCRVKEFEKALRVLSAMLASRHCPRAQSFRCLVMGLCEGGRVEDVCFVLEEMGKRKVGLDGEGWCVLVEAVCGSRGSGKELLNELTCEKFVQNWEGEV